MAADRFVLLGLAQPRRPWFGEVAHLAAAGSAPIEFIKCLSVEEVGARLGAGRPISAVVADASIRGVDADLIDTARGAGAAVLVVDDPRVQRDWHRLGVASVLPDSFSDADLLDALYLHAQLIGDATTVQLDQVVDDSPELWPWSGHLTAVIGVPGSGASTIAMAAAQHLAIRAGRSGTVALADLSLRPDLAMYHDVGDIVPSIVELVDAHRHERLGRDAVRSLLFDIEARGYHLLLGLRRRRDWATLRQRSFERAIDGLLSTYDEVIGDIDDDLDGQDETGSADLADRNMAARIVTRRAELVVAVGTASLRGLHGLVRVVTDLLDHGVDPARIIPVINRAPGSGRARSSIRETLDELLVPALEGAELGIAPVFVPQLSQVESRHQLATRLPHRLGRPISAAMHAVRSSSVAVDTANLEPIRIGPQRSKAAS